MNTQYLTVDADAHLRKLASNYYRSEALNIIELIRSSIRRGASIVRIKLDKKSVKIEDDGNGISGAQIAELKKIANLNGSQLEREEGIQSFIRDFGIDILVMFSFIPLDIKIKNTRSGNLENIFIKDTGLHYETKPPFNPGTTIIIKRKCENLKDEIRIITEYCKNIGDKIEINGKLIKQRTIIQNMIISVYANNGTINKNIEIGIAKTGNLCKLWKLDAGIPVSVKTFSNINGFIFEIVKDNISTVNIKDLSVFVEKLYLHLADNYEVYPEEIKQRIKELIYTHYKISNNNKFINMLNSFNILGKARGINIDQLKRIEKNRKIYAVLDKKALKRTDTIGKTILFLDHLDIDLLVNSFNFNINFLHKYSNKIRLKEMLISKLVNKTKIFLSKRIFNLKKLLTLSEDEMFFIKEMGSYLKRSSQFNAIYHESKKIKIQFTSQRLLVPAISIISGEYISIYISREHHKVKRSLTLFKTDPRNLEWLIPQIVYGS